MESVLIGILLGVDLNDLQVLACLSMCESDSVMTKYWQCFILSRLFQTKNLIPACWCPLFPIRVNSLVMTHHDDKSVSNPYVEIISWRHHHTLNKTNSPSQVPDRHSLLKDFQIEWLIFVWEGSPLEPANQWWLRSLKLDNIPIHTGDKPGRDPTEIPLCNNLTDCFLA